MGLGSKVFGIAKKAQMSKKVRNKEKEMGQKVVNKFKNNKNDSSNNK